MPRPKLDNVEQKVRAELVRGRFWAKLKPGARIAVTAGSRGISNIDLILRTVISVLQEKGAQPFLVAAMGSHGGGTAQGQLDILKSLGITETAMGAPVLATTEAREVGCLQEGLPAYQNKLALESDGIIVVNRVKPHTSFRGEVESGLMKMMVVGLGNAAGATAIHNLGTKGLTWPMNHTAMLTASDWLTLLPGGWWRKLTTRLHIPMFWPLPLSSGL